MRCFGLRTCFSFFFLCMLIDTTKYMYMLENQSAVQLFSVLAKINFNRNYKYVIQKGKNIKQSYAKNIFIIFHPTWKKYNKTVRLHFLSDIPGSSVCIKLKHEKSVDLYLFLIYLSFFNIKIFSNNTLIIKIHSK